MAKKVCALCGYTATAIFWGAIDDVPCFKSIDDLDIGLCTHKKCAENVSIITTFLHKAHKIKIKTPVHKLALESIELNIDKEGIKQVKDAINYCKPKISGITNSFIKAEIQNYVALAEAELAKQETGAIAVRELYQNLEKQVRNVSQKLERQSRDFRAFYKYASQFTASDGTWLGCDSSYLYLDFNTAKNLSALKKDEADIVTCLYDKGYSVAKANSYQIAAESIARNLERKSVFSCAKIPLENIIYFKETGQVEHITKISGGEISGGGVNWEAASKGAYWLGAAGAIIGSQMGTEIKQSAIKTTVETKDSRQVSLQFRNSEGKVREHVFPYEYYSFFKEAIPEKEFSIVSLGSPKAEVTPPPKEESKSNSPFEEIKKFKELLDCGIITEEEFAAKKKELLGL